MPKKDVRDVVRRLVVDHYYLPYAHAVDLARTKLCEDIHCIKERAIRILVDEGGDAELYRQLIYMLSTYNVITGLSPYILALIRRYALKAPLTSYEYLRAELGRGEWWRKEGYKDAVKVYGDLIQLNFAYTPLQHVIDDFLEPLKKRTQRKILVASLQSRALIGRMPLRPFEPSTVDEETAEKVVDFSLKLRQRVIEGFLRLRPRKAGDIFHYVYQWALKEVEKLEKLRHLVRNLGSYVYEELFIAPYYLHHYGIINIDLIKYELFWEIEG